MTRRDYEVIANTIVNIVFDKTDLFNQNPELLDSIIQNFSKSLKEDNKSFYEIKFRKFIMKALF